MTHFHESAVRRNSDGRFAAGYTLETQHVDLSEAIISPYHDVETNRYRQMTFEEQRDWQRNAKDVTHHLPASHRAALQRYASESFATINAHLRGVPEVKPVSQRYLSTLDRAIASGMDDQERVLFRGLRLARTTPETPDIDVVSTIFTPGSISHDPAYVSTSEDPHIALERSGSVHHHHDSAGVVLEIRGATGCPVPNNDFWESERLLPRGSTFRIDNVSDAMFETSFGDDHRAIVVHATYLDTTQQRQ